MAGIVGTSPTAAILASRRFSSHSSKATSFFLPPAPGLSLARKFCGGIGVPLKKGRSQFSIANVATEISPAQEQVQKLAASKESQRPVYPFAAIVGQDEMKLCLLLNVIDPKIGGVMIMGDRGTGKSTTVRSLVDLLPEIKVVAGDPFNSDAEDAELQGPEVQEKLMKGEQVPVVLTKINMVDLPLGATEDRVCGTIDIEKALTEGVKAFEPGLLAKANRGILYVDEVNLLDDHLVDVLLDSAASGWNTVEREGISISHPARFILIGSGNPEEGELRPQLLDRFGMHAQVGTVKDAELRVKIVEERARFDRNPKEFRESYKEEQEKLQQQISSARNALSSVAIDHDLRVKWEFANEGFLRGQKHLLKSISRRKPAHGHPQHQQQPNGQSSAVGACVEVGKFGLEEEVERLKRDKNVLMQELVRLRQQQQATDGQLQAMVQRLQGMEQRQQQMMSFLAKAVNSPGFLAQFMQQPNDSNRHIADGNKKRRLKQDGASVDDSVSPSDGQIVKYQPMMNEAAKAMLRQIMKLDSSPRCEKIGNASDSFLLDDGSSSSNLMDCDSSSNHVSGVTLQEVPPTSGPTFVPLGSAIKAGSSATTGAPAEIGTIPGGSPLVGSQEAPPITLPSTDAMIPDLSQMVTESNVDIVGSETENGIFMDPAALAGTGKIPFEIGGFSPDPQMEWDNNLLDEIPELPAVSDPFWEKFLQSPPPAETDMVDSALTDDLPEGNEIMPMENGWDKSQHMAQLTEQMGLLSSDANKV